MAQSVLWYFTFNPYIPTAEHLWWENPQKLSYRSKHPQSCVEQWAPFQPLSKITNHSPRSPSSHNNHDHGGACSQCNAGKAFFTNIIVGQKLDWAQNKDGGENAQWLMMWAYYLQTQSVMRKQGTFMMHISTVWAMLRRTTLPQTPLQMPTAP